LFLKMTEYKREKEREGPITLFSTFSMFGGEIPRPALYYVNFRNNVIYIILNYFIIIEKARKFGACAPAQACGRGGIG
jgi:hypothetical protein